MKLITFPSILNHLKCNQEQNANRIIGGRFHPCGSPLFHELPSSQSLYNTLPLIYAKPISKTVSRLSFFYYYSSFRITAAGGTESKAFQKSKSFYKEPGL